MTTWAHKEDLSAGRQRPAILDDSSANTLDRFWFNRPFDFLSSIDPLDKQTLLGIGEKRRFKKDEIIFNAGSLVDNVFFLLDGRVKIFQLSPVGKEVILWFCFSGDIFGLAEMLQSQRREVYSQACSDVDVLVIDKNRFKEFLLQHPAVALKVVDWLSCRLRELGDVLLNLAADDVTSRVIKLIARLSARYGKQLEDVIHLDIPLTHQEMADMIGASRQTVTAVLGKLKRDGTLRIENRAIYIQSPDWIESIAHSGSRPPNSGEKFFTG